jgi:hypothetical protein
LAFIVVGSGAFFFYQKTRISKQDLALEEQKKALPEPKVTASSTKLPAESLSPESEEVLPDEYNLDVPFTSQAPHADWDFTHEEVCEEASILMANRYFKNIGFEGADDAENSLQEIIAWEKENLGFFESTTAQETARVIREMLGLGAEVIEEPSVDQIKRYIFENKLVLVPAAGRELGNPFFKQPGPLYHMLVIRGYTDTQFITNDPGTKRGENYPYDFETILDANHDWNGGDVSSGEKVVIVVSK